MTKKVVVLGSTGCLGKMTMDLLSKHKNSFKTIGISANRNEKLLKEQARKFGIKETALYSKGEKPDISKADIVINVLSGVAGIDPSLETVKKEKTLLLANKESVVAEGLSIENHKIIPLDSEHNAIYEILKSRPGKVKKDIEKIYLPCSGGPFYDRKDLEGIKAKEATTHPRWDMGEKISVESATLINKGLEIIEAHHLFSLSISKIKVFLHPECEIHGIVKFKDETLAYFAEPDMSEHLENALLRAVGKTPEVNIKPVNLDEMKLLPPKNKKLPGIEVVLEEHKKAPGKMLEFLKKEEAVINLFLEGKIEFREIFKRLTNEDRLRL